MPHEFEEPRDLTPPELAIFENKLRTISAGPAQLNRDTVLYQAGWAAALAHVRSTESGLDNPEEDVERSSGARNPSVTHSVTQAASTEKSAWARLAWPTATGGLATLATVLAILLFQQTEMVGPGVHLAEQATPQRQPLSGNDGIPKNGQQDGGADQDVNSDAVPDVNSDAVPGISSFPIGDLVNVAPTRPNDLALVSLDHRLLEQRLSRISEGNFQLLTAGGYIDDAQGGAMNSHETYESQPAVPPDFRTIRELIRELVPGSLPSARLKTKHQLNDHTNENFHRGKA